MRRTPPRLFPALLMLVFFNASFTVSHNVNAEALPPSYSSSSHVQGLKNSPASTLEKKMLNLLNADYHLGLYLYYMNYEKAGFMPLERFNLSRTRAIGDIREAIKNVDPNTRIEKLLIIQKNWQLAFERARFMQTAPRDA